MFIGTFLTVLVDSVKGLTIPNVWLGVVMAMHMPEERQDRFTGLILKMEYLNNLPKRRDLLEEYARTGHEICTLVVQVPCFE